jgi:energy-coupling factor transporter ATP-binding protein EcfA2
VADEPTGNLDRTTGESIIALFKRLAAEKGLAILTTTHNTAFAYEADRAITLEDGRIVKPAGIWLISEHTCWKAVMESWQLALGSAPWRAVIDARTSLPGIQELWPIRRSSAQLSVFLWKFTRR